MRADAERLAAALVATDLAVFHRPAGGALEQVVDVPPWFVRAWGLAEDGPPRLTEAWLARSDFLAWFLEDAAELWRAGREGRVCSGPWSESTLDAGATQFEATAVALDGRHWLFVECLGPRHAQRRAGLQTARDRSLFFEQLVAAHEERFILLDCIVHDLAGPLQAVRGCLDMLRRAPGLDESGKWVERALRQVRKQEVLIDDVLDSFGPPMGRGAQENDSARCDVAVCASDVVESLSASAEAHGKALALGEDADPAQSFPVAASAVAVERVIGNLVLNAIRVTPPQSTVVVSVRADGPDVVVTVDDEGPGVPSEEALAIFERGRRLSRAGRAGLGLYVARRAVEAWGGAIGHFSLGERGSRFWFRLPLSSDVGTRQA